MTEPAYKRQLISTLLMAIYATPLMTPNMVLGLSIRLSMFELRETGVCVCYFVLFNQYWGIIMYGPGASS